MAGLLSRGSSTRNLGGKGPDTFSLPFSLPFLSRSRSHSGLVNYFRETVMHSTFDRQLFDQIFSDANVADLDFSIWDKSIALWVFADHVDVPTPARLPLFMVEFIRVRRFCATFNHFAINVEGPDEHIQWNVDDFKLAITDQGLSIQLFSGKTSPRLEIDCDTVNIRRMDSTTIDRLFPGWSRPGRGFVRPGIDRLAKLLGKGKEKGETKGSP